jgi:hypothetical protein
MGFPKKLHADVLYLSYIHAGSHISRRFDSQAHDLHSLLISNRS